MSTGKYLSYMKKSIWRYFQLPKKRKPKPKPELVPYKPPKKHMTEPDHWTPPFETKKTSLRKNDKQDLVVVKQLTNFDLGKVTATVGIMLQTRIDGGFELFVNESLERFKNLDWGGVAEVERCMNERRIEAQTGVIYGIYTYLNSGVQIWIATDFDKGFTKICLSDEL